MKTAQMWTDESDSGAPRPGRRGTPGYTLVETVVILTIMIVLAAAFTANVTLSTERARDLENVVETLAEFEEAMPQFFDDTNHNPGFLSHLSNPITTSQVNICGSTYPGGAVNAWAGPYTTRLWGSGAIPVSIGLLQDSLILEPREPGRGSAKNDIARLEIHEVDPDVAEEFNAKLDGDVSSTMGTITWSEPVDGKVTVHYRVPIKGC